VAGPASELLGVEVEPCAVGGVLRSVEVLATRLGVRGRPTRRRDEREPAGSGEIADRKIDERQGLAVRADAVQEVIAAGVVGDAYRGPTPDRGGVDVPVVGGQVDQVPFGIEDVVVVDGRDAIDGYLFQFGRRADLEAPQ
jgi:hypothetical protein